MIGQSRTRLLGVTVLIAVFAVGGLTGAVVQRTAQAVKAPARTPQRGPSLFETLKLTDAQQKQVCSIMEQNQEKMKPHAAIMQREWKAIRALIDSTNMSIDSVLTPEQRTAKDEFRAARQKFFQSQGRGGNDKGGPRQPEPEHRGARPGPGNPLGITCPGLNDGPPEPMGPSDGGRHGWRGDSAHKEAQPATPAAKPEHQS
jgi:Spy/CpxP family protein refolding chaperone